MAKEAAYSTDVVTPLKANADNKTNSEIGDFPRKSLDDYMPEAGTRYVGGDGVRLRSKPGLDSDVVGKMNTGDSVHFTGKKTHEIDGHQWAEVQKGEEKGWAAADYLKTDKPQETSSNVSQNDSASSSSIIEKPTQSESVNSDKTDNKIDINDHAALKNAFNKVRKPGATNDAPGEFGDFDGSGELQCPDVPKWFLSKFTTLKPVSGNGKDQVGNLANTYGLDVTTTPCAPAVFSVAGRSAGPGTTGTKDGGYGHTGVILSCELTETGDYKLTYFHTYRSLLNDGKTSDIQEKVFTPEQLKNTTFLDLKDHMIENK